MDFVPVYFSADTLKRIERYKKAREIGTLERAIKQLVKERLNEFETGTKAK
jgi:hypothetical protein